MNDLDEVIVDRLRCTGIVGVYDYERTVPRELFFSLRLFCDLRQAGQSDKLEHTVDYDALSKEIRSLCTNTQFELIETLAERASEICLSNILVKACEVRIDKPGAVMQTESVAVKIFRSKKDSEI